MSDLSRLNRDKPVKAKGMVHELVADTAKEMAGAYYEGAARNNAFYAHWPSLEGYKRAKWQSFIQHARTTLAEMLGMPDGVVSPDDKAKIHEALIKNAAVNPAQNLLTLH